MVSREEKILKGYARNVNGDTVSLFRHELEQAGAFVVWHYADQSPQLVWYARAGDAATAYVSTRKRWSNNGELKT